MHTVQERVTRPKLAEGTHVRVKVGVMAPDCPYMHLGDWTGSVSQVQKGYPVTYLIRWSTETLENVHPAYRDYCEKNGLDFDRMWLMEGYLESELAYV